MFAKSCDHGALGGAHHPTEIPVFKGFRDFLMRGNIIELAIAVVIGTAFTALVASFSKFIINPIIATVGGHSVNGLAFYLVPGNAATLVDIGGVVTAAINFFITAAVVYFIFVVPMNKLAERRRKNLEPVAVDPTELDLLVQIRDLLAGGKVTITENPVTEAAAGDLMDFQKDS
jgi:large conductance mechanosensitive channel